MHLFISDGMKYNLIFCSISDGEVEMVGGSLSKTFLEKNKCYLLDCGAEVIVWVGRGTQLNERKKASQVAEVICYLFCTVYCSYYMII